MFATEAPFPQYLDAKGGPLDDGYLYFGVANLNPETNPVTVYWDVAGTQPVAQPVRTLNGYTVRNGTPALVYSDADYSLTVRDARGRFVYGAASSAAFGNAYVLSQFQTTVESDQGAYSVGYLTTGTLVSPRSVGDKLNEQVSLLDYMNSSQRSAYINRTLAVDLYTPIQNAINEVQGNNVDLFATRGSARVSQPLTITGALAFLGAGRWKGTLLSAPSATTGLFTILTDDAVEISRMFLQGNAAATAGRGISLSGGTMNAYSFFRDLIFAGFYDQFYSDSSLLWGIENVDFNGAMHYATHIANLYNADAGDSYITGCAYSNSPSARACIHYVSGGGLRLSNFKLNSGQWGILVECDGVTSDLIVSDFSIENTSVAGIAFGHTSGSYSNVQIGRGQISLTPAAILMNDSAPTYDIVQVSDIEISGVDQYGALFENIGRLQIDTFQAVGPGVGVVGSVGLKIGASITNADIGSKKISGFEHNFQNLSTNGTISKYTRPLISYASSTAAPVNTAENTIVSASIPVGYMDVDSAIDITLAATLGGAGSKTLRVKIGASVIWTAAYTAAVNIRVRLRTCNANALNSQITVAEVLVDGVPANVASTASAADMSITEPLSITVQKATAGDSVVINQFFAELLA